jgi:RNA-directed DNA polymerase
MVTTLTCFQQVTEAISTQSYSNSGLVRWACRKFKRLRRREKKARELLAASARRYPDLFAHWRFGVKPDGWTMGAV